MELYTCQNEAVYDKIVKDGCHYCDVKKSPWYKEFRKPYNWLARRLAEKIAKPDVASYPIWAYKTLPEEFDYRTQGAEGERCVFLRLEVPDEEVAFINASKWADVVCCGYVTPDGIGYDEIEAFAESFEKASRKEREANWEAVFDLSDCSEGAEAVFWGIKASYVKEATHYTCHLN